MKLFTTITSERGKPVTKSGNEFINMEIQDENREVIYNFKIQTTDTGTYIRLSDDKKILIAR